MIATTIEPVMMMIRPVTVNAGPHMVIRVAGLDVDAVSRRRSVIDHRWWRRRHVSVARHGFIFGFHHLDARGGTRRGGETERDERECNETHLFDMIDSLPVISRD